MADISNKLNKESESLAGTFVEIKTNTSDFGVALTDATKKMAEFSEQYAKTTGDIGSQTKTIMQSLKGALSKAAGAFKKIPGLTKMAALGPLGAITSAATLLFKQLMQVSDTIATISKETGLVGKQLKGLTKEIKLASGGLYAYNASMTDTAKQAAALHESLGGTVKVQAKLIDVSFRIQKAMGGSAQESAALADNLIRGFGKTAPQVEKFAQSIMTFATKSGVNARKVMRDISNDSNLTAIYLSRGEDYMAKTAVMAAKMGKSMADNLATTDAFLNIESGSDLTGRLNQFFGSNLNSLKMYNLAVKQDTVGIMKELNKVISTPKGMQMIKDFPGIAKQLGAELGLNIKDMRQLGKVIADMEKTARGPTKEQIKLNKFIEKGMTLLDKLKGMIATVFMPIFNEFGTILHDQIEPLLTQGTKMAAEFGKSISAAMDGAQGLVPKLKAAFVVIMEFIGPYLDKIGNRIGAAIRNGMMDIGFMDWVSSTPDFAKDLDKSLGATGFGKSMYGTGFFGANPADAEKNAIGSVHNRPTFAMIGEENRSEVVIPTERIRKGLPVASSVARELSSIGVPGFQRGRASGGPGAAAVAASGAAQRRRSQESMVYGSQGDPNAIKRREQKIEQQAAEDRAHQRTLVNEIMKEVENQAREEYFSGGAAVPTPGGPGGKGPGSPGRSGRDWGKTMHNMAKGLDSFMKLTNTTWKDMWNTMPNRIQNPIDKAFSRLPGSIQEGLTVGTSTAWNHYLDTGKFQEALAMGTAAGIREATAQSGEFTKATGNIIAGMFEGKGWRKGLGEEMSRSLNTKGSYFNTQIASLNDKTADYTKESDDAYAMNDHLQGAMKEDRDLLEKQAQDLEIWLGPDNAQVKELRAGAKLNAEMADKMSNDNRKTQLGLAKKAAVSQGLSAGLGAGISTFAETGSFKEAGKSALISGAGTAANTGITMGLTAVGVPAPIAAMLGTIGGGLISGGLSKLFGGKKQATGAAARAKVLGGLGGALRLAKNPGGEQLYEAFKVGGRLNKMAKKNIDAAMKNSSGQMDEGLRGELIGGIGSVVTRTTGAQLSSDEIMTLLVALQGTGMQAHEQKSLLTSFERKIEGVGARGAIVNRPTVALIGEAGPEAVTPLDQTRGNGPLTGGGDLAGEIRQMNQLLAKYVSNPPAINIDGQRVSRVINAANSDDIRTGVSTVNSRV